MYEFFLVHVIDPFHCNSIRALDRTTMVNSSEKDYFDEIGKTPYPEKKP